MRLHLWLCAAAALLAPSALGQELDAPAIPSVPGLPGQFGHVTAEAVVSHADVRPGQTFHVALDVRIK